MKTIKLLFICLTVMIFLACSKDEKPTTAFGVLDPQTAQGVKMTFTYPDSSEKKVSGDRVFGWNDGQLLNGNYYKQLRGGSDEVNFDFRFSIPEDVKSVDIIEDVHELRPTRLKLEQTQLLDAMQTEFWLGSLEEEEEFDALKNVQGTVEIRVGWQGYDVMAEINGQISNRMGQMVNITGVFWKQNAEQ